MNKKLLISLVLCFILSASAGIFAACGTTGGGTTGGGSSSSSGGSVSEKNELRGFNVEKTTDTAELGETYLIENVLPYDTNGKFYDVTVSVERSSDAVIVLGGAFDCDETGEYTITYSLTFEGEEQSKTTRLTVSDTVAPVIEVGGIPAKITEGATVDLSDITARDWSGIKTISASVALGEDTVEVTDNKFTAAKGGIYAVTISAEDNAGNSTQSTYNVNCLKKNELYNFESAITPSELYGATSQDLVSDLPGDNAGSAMCFTFNNPWQQIIFTEFNADFWKAKEDAGYESVSFDVYYEGAETTNQIWVTPFGGSPVRVNDVNKWQTFTVALSSLNSGAMAFNLEGQKDYKVYLDNIILNEKSKDTSERLYYGFETMNDDAWKYVDYYTQSASDSTERAYEGTKSLKFTLNAAWSYFALRTGTGTTFLDNDWIKSKADKTFSLMVYYDNTVTPTDSLLITISNAVSGAVDNVCSQQVACGSWVNITFKLSDIQSWEKICIQLNSENAANSAVYFDDFKLIVAE